MKVVTKQSANIHKNSDTCIAYEYATKDKDINIAVIELTGRYPEKGRVVNDSCKEIVYIEKGNCVIVFADKKVILKGGDVILIEPEKAYYWEGEARLIVSCAPASCPEQHRVVT